MDTDKVFNKATSFNWKFCFVKPKSLIDRILAARSIIDSFIPNKTCLDKGLRTEGALFWKFSFGINILGLIYRFYPSYDFANIIRLLQGLPKVRVSNSKQIEACLNNETFLTQVRYNILIPQLSFLTRNRQLPVQTFKSHLEQLQQFCRVYSW